MLYLIINEIFFSLSIILVLLYCILYSISNSYNYLLLNKQIIYFTSLIILISSLILISFDFSNQYILFYSLKINNFLNYFKIIINILLFLLILSYFSFIKINKFNNFEQYILILSIQLGIFFLLNFNNLIILYLSIELISISIYLLIALNKSNIYNIEIGLKYFILGAISSNIILFGFSLLYGMTGLINYNDLILFFNSIQFELKDSKYILFLFTLLFIFIGFLFKLYYAPFHLWIIDIYQGSSSHITAYIAIIPSITFLYIYLNFIELFYILFPNIVYWFLLFCSVNSLILGTLGALYQIKIKRLFAYSTIIHNGYFMLCICLYLKLNISALFNLFLFYYFYLIILLLLFNIIFTSTFIINKFKFYNLDQLTEFKNIYIINSLLFFIFSIVLFNFAGIPPFFNFFAKIYLFYLFLLDQFNILLIILLIIIAVISCFFYIRIIKNVYYNSINKYYILNNKYWLNNYLISILFLFLMIYYLLFDKINILLYYYLLLYI